MIEQYKSAEEKKKELMMSNMEKKVDDIKGYIKEFNIEKLREDFDKLDSGERRILHNFINKINDFALYFEGPEGEKKPVELLKEIIRPKRKRRSRREEMENMLKELKKLNRIDEFVNNNTSVNMFRGEKYQPSETSGLLLSNIEESCNLSKYIIGLIFNKEFQKTENPPKSDQEAANNLNSKIKPRIISYYKRFAYIISLHPSLFWLINNKKISYTFVRSNHDEILQTIKEEMEDDPEFINHIQDLHEKTVKKFPQIFFDLNEFHRVVSEDDLISENY